MAQACAPEDLVLTLKCFFCKKFLSVGPIKTISEDGVYYKCGRCKDIPTMVEMKNFCYERVANYLKFPCSYTGCTMRIPWGEVEKHEQFCPYRIMQCVGYSCKSLVESNNFESHYQQCTAVCGERIFEDCIKNYTIHKNNDFILFLKKSTDKYLVLKYGNMSVGVFALQPMSKTILFELKINGDKKETTTLTYKEPIIEYNEVLHCPNCMRLTCNLPYHTFSSKYGKSGKNLKFLQIDIKFNGLSKFLLEPTHLTYFINILDGDNNENQTSDKDG